MVNALSIKLWRDLTIRPGRSLLIIVAMALGLTGAFAVLDSYEVLNREMATNYAKTIPSDFVLVGSGFSDDNRTAFMKATGALVEKRGRHQARIELPDGSFQEILLFVASNPLKPELDQFWKASGAWPPHAGEILIERAAVGVVRTKTGNTARVHLPNHEPRSLLVAGTTHAPGLPTAWMEGFGYGYVDENTAISLGLEQGQIYNRLLFRFEALPQRDERILEVKANEVIALASRWNLGPVRLEVPESGVGKHPHATQMQSLLILLGAFGFLALGLSIMITTNLVRTLLAEHKKQIGILKAIGTRTRTVQGFYFVFTSSLGLLSVLVALPLGFLLSDAYSSFVARMLNFTIFSSTVNLWTVIAQVAVGALLPALVSWPSVVRETSATVRDALQGDTPTTDLRFGNSQGLKKRTRFTLPSGVSMALRNSARHPGRWVISLFTMAIGGACFLAAMNIGSVMRTGVGAKFDRLGYSALFFTTARGEGTESLSRQLDAISGLSIHEEWRSASVWSPGQNGRRGTSFVMVGLPTKSALLSNLPILKGRWFSDQLAREAVINSSLARDFEKVGVDLTNLPVQVDASIAGSVGHWVVIGVAEEILTPSTAYVRGAALGPNELSAMPVLLATQYDHGAKINDQTMERQVEQILNSNGASLTSVLSLAEYREAVDNHLILLSAFLTIMSLFVVVVGGLGLSSTLGLSVLERTREIAVLKAIGGRRIQVITSLVLEGTFQALASWPIAVLMAIPLSFFIGDAFGRAFFGTPLPFAVSTSAPGIWLLLLILIAVLASSAPALNASRRPTVIGLAYQG